ncbi:MAG: hypothetical protein OCU12_07270 [Methanophagales archaeon]|nr:hypothetical protein [Methanophagales archaeon]
MASLGVVQNEVKHIRRSLAGLHRKADKTNGYIQDHEKRLNVLETHSQRFVTKSECSDHRGGTWQKVAMLVVGALIAAIVGAVVPDAIARIFGG